MKLVCVMAAVLAAGTGAAHAGVAVMDFESLTDGDRFGPAFGQNEGDLVFEEQGIRASVGHVFDGATNAQIRIATFSAGAPGFSGNHVFTGGVGVVYDFTGLAFDVTRVVMSFDDGSNDRYISINGESVAFDRPDYFSDLPATLGGISVTALGGDTRGQLVFEGAITAIELGGDELSLDTITATPAPGTAALLAACGFGAIARRRRV